MVNYIMSLMNALKDPDCNIPFVDSDKILRSRYDLVIQNGGYILCLFEQFNRLGMTILIASHDLSLISSFKHRRLTLAEGKLIDAPIPA